jgi:hypothetical protein
MMESQNTDLQKVFEGIIDDQDTYEYFGERLSENIKTTHAIRYILPEHLTSNSFEIPKNGRITIIALSDLLEQMFNSLNLKNLMVKFSSFDYAWHITYGPDNFEERKKVDGEHNWGDLTFTLFQTHSSYYLDLIPGGNNEIKRSIVSEIINLLEDNYLQ